MPTAAAHWPFVGRRTEVQAATAHLSQAGAASAGVLLVGPAGVGKTRLLDEVVATLAGAGHATGRAVGAAATHAIPYAAFAHVLPEEVLRGAGQDPNAVFDAIRARLREVAGDGDRFVLAVDDIGLLDAASLMLLVQLVNAGAVAVLATARHGQPVPPAVHGLERSHGMVRVELAPLDVDGVNELLEAAQGGTVDRRTSRELWRISQGNVLYLRELVLGALASGAMTSEQGHWRLVGRLTTTSRLLDAVADRLDGLDGDARDLAEMLAVAEPLRIDDVDAAGLGEAALALDEAGLVASAGTGAAAVVRLSHPLYGEVLGSQVSALRRRRLLLRAAAAVGNAGRSEDVMRLATWLTAADAEVDADLVKEAARRARAANDFALTEQLTQAVAERAPDLDTLLLLAEAHHEFGRLDEAEATLAAAGAHVSSDVDRLRVAVLHHRIRLWAAGDAPGSLAVLADAEATMGPGFERALVRVAMANTDAFGDRPERALAAVTPEDLSLPGIETLAAFARSVAMTRLGDPVGAAAVAHRARLDGVDPTRRDRFGHPALFMLAEGLGLAEAGAIDEADAVVSAAYAIVVEENIPQLHVWLSLMLGRVGLHRGHLATARRCFAEALAVATDARFVPGRRIALSGLAACAGQTGDVHGSATLLAELDRLPTDIEYFAAEVELGRGWALVALGRTTEAVAALRTGAERAAGTGDAAVGHGLLYEAARIHADRALAHDIRGVAVSGPLAVARVAFVDGAATGSLGALAEAEHCFAEVGADLGAAEAAARLAVELARGGRHRDAAAAQLRSSEHAARCEGAATPALLHRVEVTPLTAREREIAQLAARGMASKAIARQLGVTPRTVSNHLQNAYTKLGISTRVDLPGALGLDDPGQAGGP